MPSVWILTHQSHVLVVVIIFVYQFFLMHFKNEINILSNDVILNSVSDLCIVQWKFLKNFRLHIEIIFFSRAQVFKWFKVYLNDRESIENKSHNGRSLTIKTDKNIVRIRDLVRSDHHLMVRIIGEQLRLIYIFVH